MSLNNRWEIVVAILLMIVFEFLRWQLGETYLAFFTAATPCVLLVALFLLMMGALGRHRREIARILKNHLPELRFINEAQRLNTEMIRIVKDSNDYIVTTGGRARNDEYLSAIEKKISENDRIEYWRVVLGEYIHHRLHQHLERLFERPNANIRWHAREIYGNILASENEVLLPLADPVPGMFGTALIISNPRIAIKYKEFVLRLYGEAKVVNKDELKFRCLECSLRGQVTDTDLQEKV